MTRRMYDSVHPGLIPLDCQLVAGYVDGAYRWTFADWVRFAGKVTVPIAVSASTNDGIVLDVERFDATPAQAPGWVTMRRAAGKDPSVYCSQSVWPTVRNAFIDAQVPEPHYWIAAYPGDGPVVPAGAVAHQWVDHGDYDESVVADYWPGIDPAPTTGGTPVPVANAVDACLCPTGGSWVLGADGGGFAFGGAPFHGSYPGLPPAEREGTRSFVAIVPTSAGYTLVANDGATYSFPT